MFTKQCLRIETNHYTKGTLAEQNTNQPEKDEEKKSVRKKYYCKLSRPITLFYFKINNFGQYNL